MVVGGLALLVAGVGIGLRAGSGSKPASVSSTSNQQSNEARRVSGDATDNTKVFTLDSDENFRASVERFFRAYEKGGGGSLPESIDGYDLERVNSWPSQIRDARVQQVEVVSDGKQAAAIATGLFDVLMDDGTWKTKQFDFRLLTEKRKIYLFRDRE
jgi:hypothetical protein